MGKGTLFYSRHLHLLPGNVQSPIRARGSELEAWPIYLRILLNRFVEEIPWTYLLPS